MEQIDQGLKSTIAKKRSELKSAPHLLHLFSPANVHDSLFFGQRPWQRIDAEKTGIFLE